MRIKNYQKGFGLVEVLISAMIITTMLGGAVALGNMSINRVINAQNRLVAYGLANDAIEQIIAIRNRAYVDGDPSTGGILTQPQTTSLINSGYTAGLPSPSDQRMYSISKTEDLSQIKYNSDTITKLILATEPERFYYNNDVALSLRIPHHVISGQSNPIIFERTIIIEPAINERLKVVVRVGWKEAGTLLANNSKSEVTQKIVLTDWHND